MQLESQEIRSNISLKMMYGRGPVFTASGSFGLKESNFPSSWIGSGLNIFSFGSCWASIFSQASGPAAGCFRLGCMDAHFPLKMCWKRHSQRKLQGDRRAVKQSDRWSDRQKSRWTDSVDILYRQ